jgi:hypothetical protein
MKRSSSEAAIIKQRNAALRGGKMSKKAQDEKDLLGNGIGTRSNSVASLANKNQSIK